MKLSVIIPFRLAGTALSRRIYHLLPRKVRVRI